MQCTADFHDQVTDVRLAEAAGIVHNPAALDAAVDMLDAHAATCDAAIGGVLAVRQGPAARLAGRHDHLDRWECKRQKAQILEPPAARRSGIRGGLRHPLVVGPPLIGLTQEEDGCTALISSTFLTVWHFFLPR